MIELPEEIEKYRAIYEKYIFWTDFAAIVLGFLMIFVWLPFVSGFSYLLVAFLTFLVFALVGRQFVKKILAKRFPD